MVVTAVQLSATQLIPEHLVTTLTPSSPNSSATTHVLPKR